MSEQQASYDTGEHTGPEPITDVLPICEVSNHCLECPLSACQHDDPIWYRNGLRIARQLAVRHMMGGGGWRVEDVASKLGVSPRTIHRWISLESRAFDRYTPADVETFLRLQSQGL